MHSYKYPTYSLFVCVDLRSINITCDMQVTCALPPVFSVRLLFCIVCPSARLLCPPSHPPPLPACSPASSTSTSPSHARLLYKYSMLPARVRPLLLPPLCKSATLANDSATASSPQARFCHPSAHSICTRLPLPPANLPPLPASPPVPPSRLPNCALTSSVHMPKISLYNPTSSPAHVPSLLNSSPPVPPRPPAYLPPPLDCLRVSQLDRT